MTRNFVALTVLAFVTCANRPTQANVDFAAEVYVCGGTASGVTAAVAAAREGAKVIIVDPIHLPLGWGDLSGRTVA